MRTLQSKAFFATSFALALALALTLAAVARATPSYEPNDSFDDAYGPLAANTTYSDTIADVFDDDIYYFYVTDLSGSEVQVNVTDTIAGGEGVYVELDDSDGGSIDYADVAGGDSVTLDDQLDPGQYYVAVSAEADDQVNEDYSLEISAKAGALGDLADVKAGCNAATASVSSAKAALARAQKRLKRAHKGSAHRKAQARRAVKKAKDKLRSATADMNAACGALD